MADKKYELYVADRTGAKLEYLDQAKSRKYARYLNAAGSASFFLDPRDPKATEIKTMERDLLVYRYGSLVWRGRIMDDSGEVDGQGGKLDVKCLGYFALLDSHVDKTLTYTQIDQGAIAWNLINYVQGKDSLGITQGNTTTGVLRDRTYHWYEMGEVKKLIENLSRLENGFDFEVTPSLVFNTYYPRKQNVLGYYVFELTKNIERISWQKDGTRMANAVNAMGAGQEEQTLMSSAQNAASITTYGRREDVKDYTDIILKDTLTEKAQREVSLRKDPPTFYGLKLAPVGSEESDPPVDSYDVGDKIYVRASYGYVEIDEYLRIYGIETEIDENDVEHITLIVTAPEV